MSRFRLPPYIALVLSVMTLLAVTLACALPGQTGGTSPAAATPIVSTGEKVEIPSGLLTEVAATLFAPYQATWTAQAARPVATSVPAKPAAPTQAAPTEAMEQPTESAPTAPATPPTSPPPQAPTAMATESAATAAAQATAANIPLPTAYVPTYPPYSFTSQGGKAFTVFGLNLANCGGTYAANFLIENTGSQTLESLSLQFTDLSTDQDLYGPTVSNAPFMWSDRECTPGGIDRLAPGYWLFAGAPLGPGPLSGHSILANFLFCSGENLNGQCYPRSVEFVVP